MELDHVAVAVRDLKAACQLYERLGFAVGEREEIAGQKVRVAMLPLGESRLELMEPTAADSSVGRFLARRGEGLHHIAVRVPDLAEAVAELQRAGARLIDAEPQTGAGGHRFVFVHPASTGGVLLELVEAQR